MLLQLTVTKTQPQQLGVIFLVIPLYNAITS